MDVHRVQAGLKLIARGIETLADGLADASELTEEEREVELGREWNSRGLDQKEASALCLKHGFAGQKVGAWVRGGLIEIRADELRYLTDRALERLAAGRSPATA